MLLTDPTKAFDLLILDKTLSRILIVHDRNELGDYLHKVLPLLFLIKQRKPKAEIHFLNLKPVKECVVLINEKMGLCTLVTEIAGRYDYVLVNDCSKYFFPVVQSTSIAAGFRQLTCIKVPLPLKILERTLYQHTYVYNAKKQWFGSNLIHDRAPMDYRL